MAIDERYFNAIYQYFEEGLFKKKLSMRQALRLAHLIMGYVDPKDKADWEAANKIGEQKALDAGNVING